MPAYVLMKAFENAPARYDGVMDVLTFGRIRTLKRDVAGAVRGASPQVLELGCGTGALAIMMARTGATVLGIDTSELMLETARDRVDRAGLGNRVEVRRLSVMEIDSLPQGSFDFVVSTLVLSELTEQEVEFVLRESRRLLSPHGQLLVGDEVAPRGRLARILLRLFRFPLELVTYLITQAQSLPPGWSRRVLYFAIELPLMLLVFFVVPSTSRPLTDPEALIERAGFRVKRVRGYLGRTLKLLQAAA